MTIEADILATLTARVSGRVFRVVAPLSTPRPYIVYQQIGGDTIALVDNSVPTKKNGMFQFKFWADDPIAAEALQLLCESDLKAATVFQARELAAPMDLHEPDLAPPRFGKRQDFSIWSAR